MKNLGKISLGMAGFLQGLGVFLYCGLVALLLWRGNDIFGKVPNYFGPFLFLILFSTSALVCAIITLYYPFILFFKKKQTDQAVKLVINTAVWLFGFTILILLVFFFTR